MEKRYEAYINSFGLAYEEPMSYEMFVQVETEKDAKAAEFTIEVEKAISKIAHLYEIEEMPEDRMDCQRMMRKFQMMSNEMSGKASDKTEQAAHIELMRRMSKTLAEIFNPSQKATNVSMKATNVYDNDDRPTSH